MIFLYAKAIHIIFVVCWFAGLFYSVRLFIYFTEAENKSAEAKHILQTQYKLMSKRLWYVITWPSAIITALSAIVMVWQMPELGRQPWFVMKLGFVGLLYLYHFRCHVLFRRLQNDELKTSPFRLRLWNEGASLLLFAIVFMVILKSAVNWVWGVAGLVGLAVTLMFGIKAYRKTKLSRDTDTHDKP